jgi:hypothetical protein
MSRKYIRKQILQDFVYPNNDVPQYDIDNIVHDINGNSVSGTVNSLSTISVSQTGLTFTLNYTWNLNSAEPYINSANLLGLVSVHVLPPSQQYYKPWRLVNTTTSSNTVLTTITQSTTFTITPSMFNLIGFTNGTYYFEVRFIGHRSVYPICTNVDITIPVVTPTPTSTPTPTPTPGGPTPTPTPTPGGPTPTPTLTPTSNTFEYLFCGRGNGVSEACNDAAINNRTFYSNCDSSTFGAGCTVYEDLGGTTPLIGYTDVFMNGANWSIVDTTGIIAFYSPTQC